MRYGNKLLIIGLDGGTLDLVRPWVAAGLLPNLEHLITKGASGTLLSTIPTISPAAWTSMITGKNPGRHGIYDFIRRRRESYELEYVRPDLPRLRTMFHRASRRGHRVGVIGVPMTYPPEPVNGFMISGPWAPENEHCVHPPNLFPFLKERGYEINNSMAYSPENAVEFVEYLEQVTDVRAQVALELLQREAWDLFMVVFRDTDTVASFFWHDMDASHPLHDPARAERFEDVILNHYRQLDRYIGLMMDSVEEDTSVMIVSDHGTGSLHAEICLNRWLLDLGLLKLKKQAELRDRYFNALRWLGVTRSDLIDGLGWPLVHRMKGVLPGWLEDLIPWSHNQLVEQVDWSQTKAYSLGSVGQIYINMKGREPEGIVEPGNEYEEVIGFIVSHLGDLRDPRSGKKINADVYRREDIYEGPFSQLGPDLNVMFEDMRYITHITLDAVREQLVSAPADHETGFHRLNGMYILHGPHTRKGVVNNGVRIVDVAPTVLYLLKEQVPQDMDGRVMTELFETSFLSAHPPQHETTGTPAPVSDSEDEQSWTAEEEEQITQHLRDLGYLG